MKIQESGENYLEAILMIREEKGTVRSIDVAHHLEFSKPSVSRAMSLLRENGYIHMDKDGLITLTDSGMASCCRLACAALAQGRSSVILVRDREEYTAARALLSVPSGWTHPRKQS